MRAQLLFLFIFFVSFTTQNQILLEKIESSKYENNFRLLKVDDMGNKYYLNNNKYLKKNNLSFSDLSFEETLSQYAVQLRLLDLFPSPHVALQVDQVLHAENSAGPYINFEYFSTILK